MKNHLLAFWFLPPVLSAIALLFMCNLAWRANNRDWAGEFEEDDKTHA